MKALDKIKEGWPRYLVAPVKVLPNLLETRLLPCWAVFARAGLILDELFLKPNIQPPFFGLLPSSAICAPASPDPFLLRVSRGKCRFPLTG